MTDVETSQSVDYGVKSESCTKVLEQDVVSKNDGIASDLVYSKFSSKDAISYIKGETDQESVAERGVNYPPTSCYNYYYPGYNGVIAQLDDHSYFNADGSYTGIQSDNGSLVYYMPGYNQYAAGVFMGVDEQCSGPQPYFPSSGFFQPAVSYGSEAVPCYSWDSTLVRDVPNGTTAIHGMAKSVPIASMKTNGLNSIDSNGNIAGISSALPLDSNSWQSAAPSNFSHSNLYTQSLKPLNKVPHYGYDFQSAGFMKGVQPRGKFASFTNQRQGVFPRSGAVNHRPNSRLWYGNDKYESREKLNKNGELESLAELTRGPRAHNSFSISTSPEKEELGVMVRRNNYNLPDFQIQYEVAKFFVIKSFSEDDIHKCIKYDVWSSTPNGNKKLDASFHDAETKARESGSKCPIFLFFSVNGSGQFVGLAEMIGPVDFNKNMNFWQLDKWSGFFPVKWHIIKDIPNTHLRHIFLENNDNKSVTLSRDTQEIGLKRGLDMLDIFRSYVAKTSLLDDFNFYENRAKSLPSKRNSKSSSPQTEVCSRVDFPRHLKPGERKIGEQVRAQGKPDSGSSLISLTKNLSLNARPTISTLVEKPVPQETFP